MKKSRFRACIIYTGSKISGIDDKKVPGESLHINRLNGKTNSVRQRINAYLYQVFIGPALVKVIILHSGAS
jgi:hypothetical protein